MNENVTDSSPSAEQPEKLSVNYGKHVFTVPASVLPKLKNAKKNDIIILLGFLSSPGADPAALASICQTDEASVASALSYWRGAGVVSLDDGEESAGPAAAPAKEKKSDRLLETVPSYTSEEVAAIVSSDRSVSSMLDELQQILGRIFGQTDTVRIISVMNYYGIDPEYILLTAAHCASSGKKAVAYLVSAVSSLCEHGIGDVDTLNEYLMAIAKTASLETRVRALFGINTARALSDREKEFLTDWSEKYQYGYEIITLAYNIAVDATGGNPTMPYTNAILRRWYEAGLRTDSDIKNYLDAEKKGEKGGRRKSGAKKDAFGDKSFDPQDFFTKSLLRTYGGTVDLPGITSGERDREKGG